MDDLVKVALAGTGRGALLQRFPPVHPAEAAAAAAAGDSLERALLLRAAARSVYDLAGTPTVAASACLPEPFAAAPDDQRPECPAAVVQWMREHVKLQEPLTRLIEETCELIQQRGMRLPAEFLVMAITARSKVLRRAFLPILGRRGRWLAALHPEGGWVAEWGDPGAVGPAAGARAGAVPANADALWSDGTTAERAALVRAVRAVDPSRGRAWLESCWKSEKADVRKELLQAFDAGLSADDEPFLESCLNDRSSAVAALAVRMLVRIPGSALLGRMLRRGDAILNFLPPKKQGFAAGLAAKVLGRSEPDSGRLLVTPPKSFDPEMARDGLVEKAPTGIGAQQFWMTQILELIPPAHWVERFSTAPAPLVAACLKDEDGAAVFQAWARAAMLHRDPAWCLELARAVLSQAQRADRSQAGPPAAPGDATLAAELLRQVADRDREAVLIELLSDLHKRRTVNPEQIGLLLPDAWTVETARAFLSVTRGVFEQLQALPEKKYDAWAAGWSGLFMKAAQAIPVELFPAVPEFVARAELEAKGNWAVNHIVRNWDGFLQIIELRKRIRAELSAAAG